MNAASVSWEWGAALSAAGAFIVEIFRRKAAIDELTEDMRKRVLRGADPLAGRTLRYPKGYALSLFGYAVVAAVMSLLIRDGSSPLVYLYVGLSLPKFGAYVIKTAEPYLPGAVSGSVPAPPNATESTPRVDDTAVTSVPRVHVKTGPGRYRNANGLMNYLTS